MHVFLLVIPFLCWLKQKLFQKYLCFSSINYLHLKLIKIRLKSRVFKKYVVKTFPFELTLSAKKCFQEKIIKKYAIMFIRTTKQKRSFVVTSMSVFILKSILCKISTTTFASYDNRTTFYIFSLKTFYITHDDIKCNIKATSH